MAQVTAPPVAREDDPAAPPPLDRSRFRPDIEGLRAIAVGSVLLWHAGVPGIPGGFVGVDVFFVISGYLMTNLLVRELEQRGHISFRGFYARRAKRLLPAASFTLAWVAILTILLLPKIRWAEVGKDIVASGLYGINWRLANGSVDYLAAHAAPSPVQHFWSLAVEEQFYFIWPLVLAVIGVLARRRASKRGPVIVGLCLIAIPSFLWSVYYTAAAPEKAYFVTTTRLWELAVGGLVAVLAPTLLRVLRPAVAAALGWLGLAAVAVTILVLESSAPFPGAIAAVPILGTAAVIAVGPSAGRHGPVAVLRAPVMQFLGKLSYSLYLWHWPILVVAAAVLLDKPGSLDPWRGLLVVCLSIIPAWISFRLVEEPVRRRRPSPTSPHTWPLRLGLACTILSVVAGLGVYTASSVVNRPLKMVAGQKYGAEVLPDQPRGAPQGEPVDNPGRFLPGITAVRNDIPSVYADGCHVKDNNSPVAKGCTYGNRNGSFTVAVVGDSHAAQWVPTFQALAKTKGWRVLAYTKSGCPLADETVPLGKDERPYVGCDGWNKDVTSKLLAAKPDVVVTSATEYPVMDGTTVLGKQVSDSRMVNGIRRSWARLTSAGIRVLAVADTPRPGFDMADCVSSHEGHLTACALPRTKAFKLAGSTVNKAAAGQKDVRLVDLGDFICPDTRCAPVIGHVMVYRDTDHLTATYARTLADRMYAAMGPFAQPAR